MNEREWKWIATVHGSVSAEQVREVLEQIGVTVVIQADLLTGTYMVKGLAGGRLRVYVRPEQVRKACEALKGMIPPEAFEVPGHDEDTSIEDFNGDDTP
jgi:hypothetical protein